eukprot:1185661-Prymnesium_polylepis.1
MLTQTTLVAPSNATRSPGAMAAECESPMRNTNFCGGLARGFGARHPSTQSCSCCQSSSSMNPALSSAKHGCWCM